MKKTILWSLLVAFAPWVNAAQRPNVLFIAIDDLRNELGLFGVRHAKTPNLDAFGQSARVFNHHYTHVPTCGASRCSLLHGRYPHLPAQLGNNAIRETQAEWGAQNLPGLFHQHGYRTLALGKITHYPGGLTGKGWAEGPEELPGVWDRSWIPASPWKTPEAIMHGYANGAARERGKSSPWEIYDGPDEAFPDAWVATEATAVLKDLAERGQPWFFAVGFFKPHLPFAAPKKWHDLHAEDAMELPSEAASKPTWPSGWHGSGEFRGHYKDPHGRDPATDSEYARFLRRAYAGAVSYMDAQVGRLLQALKTSGMDENTIVVVWGDHGFLLGEHAIWGKHCLYEQALRSPLMVRHPGLKLPGKQSAAVVETVDIFPTLAELCGLSMPAGLDGRSLRAQLADPAVPSSKPARGFWGGGQRTIRTERWRLIEHSGKNGREPRYELFDCQNDPQETKNCAESYPEAIKELVGMLDQAPQIGR